MNKASHALLALIMLLGTLCTQASALEPGQSIGISFGATAPDNNFNQCNPADPNIQLTGTLSALFDTAGNPVPGVVAHFGGAAVVSNTTGTTQDFSNYDNLFSLQNIQNAVMGDNLTLTFSGLDITQRFTLDLVSSYQTENLAIRFSIVTNSVVVSTFLTNSTSTTGGTRAHFTDIAPGTDGIITIKATCDNPNYNPNWAGVNAAVLKVQAVPEPSTETLLGLVGIVALTLRYRVRALKSRLSKHL